MNTDTLTRPDVDLLASLEFQPPCDGVMKLEDCDRAATWMMVAACCGREYLKCDGHVQRIKRLTSESRGTCGHCGHIFDIGENPFASLERM